MPITDAEIIGAILIREGGFIDHPADKGGPTNHGVTLAVFREYVGKPVGVEELQALTEDEARAIFEERYLDAPGFKGIVHAQLRGLLVDMAVNHGPARAVKLLQRAVGTKEDGVLGEKTKAAANENPAAAYRKLVAERARFFARIVATEVASHPTRALKDSQAVFIGGWIDRACDFLDEEFVA